jgi:hypothetical protein
MSLVCKKWKSFSRYRLDTILDELLLGVNDELKAELSLAKFVTITIDLWTDRRGKTAYHKNVSNHDLGEILYLGRCFLGITAHAIIQKFRILNVVLACRMFTGEKTGARIMEMIDIICDKYGTKKKILRIVSDNGSNVLKAIRLLEAKVNEQEPDAENNEEEENIENAENSQNVSQDIAVTEDEEDEIDYEETLRIGQLLEIELIKRNKSILVRCFAHTLQLSIRDSIDTLKSLYSLMQKAFDISTKSRTKSCFVEFLETKG